MIDLTGSRAPLVNQPLPQDDPRQRKPDIALATEHFGGQPAVQLREGLRETIAHFGSLFHAH